MPRLRVPGQPRPTARSGFFRRRRRVPVGTWDFEDWGAGSPGGEGPDDGGLAGVREPRRPQPTLPGTSMALELPRGEKPA